MVIMNIILILLNYLSLSFQKVKSALFCDDRILDIYVYDESRGTYNFLQSVKQPEDCYKPDYIDLDVDPGALIKFECKNDAAESLGGGCFLINRRCYCYDFDVVGRSVNYSGDRRRYDINFSNGVKSNHYGKFLQEKIVTNYEYSHKVPLDVDEITCLSNTISAPINIANTLNFSNFINSTFKLTNLKISVSENYNYFTLNNQQLSSSTKFNILNNVEYSSDQSRKIHIQFENYGEVLSNNKSCGFNIRFCYDSCEKCYDFDPNENSHQCLKCKENYYFIDKTKNCMTKKEMENSTYYFDNREKVFKPCYDSCQKCNDIEPNKTSHQCLKCKDNFYFIENTSNCMRIEEMENSQHYYFDRKETIFRPCFNSCELCINIEPNETSQQCLKCQKDNYFIENTNNCTTKKDMENSNYYFDDSNNTFKQCLNECSTCDNETFCKNCAEDYHFIYNETGKCISELNKEDLLYLNVTNNTYIKCPEGTEKVENNTCIKRKEDQIEANSNLKIIIILIIVILIIIIALFFFIKRCVSGKKLESEISESLDDDSSDNQLLNIFI